MSTTALTAPKLKPAVKNIAIVGFGAVGKALVRMLKDKEAEESSGGGLAGSGRRRFRIVSVVTGRRGAVSCASGIPYDQLLNDAVAGDLGKLHEDLADSGNNNIGGDRNAERSDKFANLRAAHSRGCSDRIVQSSELLNQYLDFIGPIDVLVEALPVNYATAEPAISITRAALGRGVNVVSANKAPVVHGYRELTDLAERNGVKYRFESAVMDGVPIFNMMRHCLGGAYIEGFEGVLNSTSNVILTGMESGKSFEESLKRAQDVGIAEANPSGDIDGWDAAVKVAALATFVSAGSAAGSSPGPYEWLKSIPRDSIRNVTSEMVQAALPKRYKVICKVDTCTRESSAPQCSVSLQLVDPAHPLHNLDGASAAVTIFTRELGPITVTSTDPTNSDTAYGVYQDMLECVDGAEG